MATEELIKVMVEYLELFNMEITEANKQFITNVIDTAYNRGYRKGIEKIDRVKQGYSGL